MSGKKKPYFANNWQEFKDAHPSQFIPHTFEEVMDWKVAGWELPSSVDCIIRTTHLETKKVKEFVYKRRAYAENKILQLLQDKTHEFTVITDEKQHYVGPSRHETDE
jgi:hypothetical protein